MALTRHIPNAITSMNLLCGVLGVICALEGMIAPAFGLMVLGAVFDFCDGLAARLLQAYSPIGKELDSLADLVSFGVLPALMLYKVQPDGANVLLRFLPLFIAVMSALRLAKFNVDERQAMDFIGLPTPSCAMVCGSLAYFLHLGGGVPDGASPWLVAGISLVLGLLLVSEIPMFGMKIKKGHKLLDGKRTAFLILAATCILTMLILHKNWSLAILGVFSVYIIENLIIALVNSR